MAKRSRNHSRRSQQDQPHATFPLRSQVLQTTTPHRERLLPSQGLPPHRHTLRQARQKLPRRSLPRRCYRLVDFMSLDPNNLTTISTNSLTASSLLRHVDLFSSSRAPRSRSATTSI